MTASVAKGRVGEVGGWLAAPTSESAMDKERLNICTMSVLSSVTSLLVGTVGALVDVDMSLSSAMVGIVAALGNLEPRRASGTCGGARGSSKKVDALKDKDWSSRKEVHPENNQGNKISFGGRAIL